MSQVWYEATTSGPPRPVEVESHTRDYVCLPDGRRKLKSTDYGWIRPTFAEAKAAAVEHLRSALAFHEAGARRARDRIAEAQAWELAREPQLEGTAC